MELIGITEQAGKSIFSLNEEEKYLSRQFLEKRQGGKTPEQNAGKIILPFINCFLLKIGFKENTKYSFITEADALDCFKIDLEEQEVGKCQDYPLKFSPSLFFRFKERNESIYLEGRANLKIKEQINREGDLAIFLNCFEELQPRTISEGIKNPLVKKTSLSSIEIIALTHLPLVIDKFKSIYHSLGEEGFMDLMDLSGAIEEEMRMQNYHSYSGQKVRTAVLDALTEGYHKKMTFGLLEKKKEKVLQ